MIGYNSKSASMATTVLSKSPVYNCSSGRGSNEMVTTIATTTVTHKVQAKEVISAANNHIQTQQQLVEKQAAVCSSCNSTGSNISEKVQIYEELHKRNTQQQHNYSPLNFRKQHTVHTQNANDEDETTKRRIAKKNKKKTTDNKQIICAPFAQIVVPFGQVCSCANTDNKIKPFSIPSDFFKLTGKPTYLTQQQQQQHQQQQQKQKQVDALSPTDPKHVPKSGNSVMNTVDEDEADDEYEYELERNEKSTRLELDRSSSSTSRSSSSSSNSSRSSDECNHTSIANPTYKMNVDHITKRNETNKRAERSRSNRSVYSSAQYEYEYEIEHEALSVKEKRTSGEDHQDKRMTHEPNKTDMCNNVNNSSFKNENIESGFVKFTSF